MSAIKSIPSHRCNYQVLWNIAKAHALQGRHPRSLVFYQSAIDSFTGADGFHLSGMHLELSRQWLLLGHPLVSLAHAGKAAVAYRGWREPYCVMAEAYFRLGDVKPAEVCLALSRGIPRHGAEIDNALIYEDALLDDYFNPLRLKAPACDAPPLPKKPIRLFAGGDVCLARQLPGWVDDKGEDWSFKGLKESLREADLVLINLESTFSTTGDFFDKKGRRPYYYRSRPEMLDVLVRAGIGVVNVANNHAIDFGIEALAQELEVLDCCGIARCGGGSNSLEAAEPAYVKVGEFMLAFIGIDTETSLAAASAVQGGINYAPEAELLKSIAGSVAMAKPHADFIVVTPHWGKNWAENPPQARRELAKKIIALGVDAILGHSAHILQGIEIHQGRPIVYDMGTLLFDRVVENRIRYSALFELEICPAGVKSLTITPVRLRSARAEIANDDDAKRVRDLIVRLSEELDPNIRFEFEGNKLVLPMNPPPAKPHWPLIPPPRHTDPKEMIPVSDFYRNLPTNVIYDTVPDGFQWPEPVEVNDGLQVLGARICNHVRPGYGFLCEVFIRAARPSGGRWEARIAGWDADDNKRFEYTNPVADGAWPQTRWKMEDIVGDRIVVRPPVDLPEGTCRLTWCLVERQSETAMTITGSHARLFQGAVTIGQLHIDSKAPAGVAGIPVQP